MPTHTQVPVLQRVRESGDDSRVETRPVRRRFAAGRLTAVAAALFAVSGVLSGALIDSRGGLAGAVEVIARTLVVVAGAVALAGGFVMLGGLRRRVRPLALGWAATILLWAGFAWLVAVPVTYAVYLTHLPVRRPVRDVDLGATKEPVTLRGADGVTLRGWYVPSRNRAAVIALHGTGANRDGVAAPARMLVRHGYGVLALDLRGHGESGGRSTSIPWKLDDDLDAAITWLSQRRDVDPARIGALGVSLGGEVALQAAARRGELRAVVAEGILGSGPADLRSGGADPAALAQVAVMIGAASLLAGEGPRASDAELVERIAPRPVLIISAGDREARIARALARRGGPAVERWNVPGASHGGAVRADRRSYERRVTAFLDASLTSSAAGVSADASGTFARTSMRRRVGQG